MLEVSELSYAAIITIELPGMGHPATISLTLSPPDVVETAPGQFKALRDCTLADIKAFGEAIEEAIWEQFRGTQIEKLADDDVARLKITLINDSGKALALGREQILEHAIQLAGPPQIVPSEAAEEEDTVPEAGAAAEAPELEAAVTDRTGDGSQEDQAGLNGGREEAPVAEAPSADLTVDQAIDATEAPVAAAPDGMLDELRIAGLRRPLGHSTSAAADILINEQAMRAAQRHALSSMDREVAGMLIGPRPEKQPDGRYVVHITDIIVARHTRMMGASVTYTPESWRYVTDRLQEKYPNEEACIVGWYHTHPGFGIFLSGMDLFIHQHFFTQLWHVALVLDPRATRMGFFCWDRAQSEVQPYDFPWPEWAANAW